MSETISSASPLASDLAFLQQRVAELEQQLRASDVRLQRSMASTPLATIEWDRQGLVRSWNPSAERIFGWSAEQALGQNVVALLVPNIAQEHVQAVVAQLLCGESANSRNVNVTKDGRLLTCQWYNALLHDEQGEVVGVLSQTEDISEQLRAEQELRDREALMLAVFDNLPSVIHVKDPDGRYLLINRRFSEFLGVTQQQIAGKTDHDMFPADVADPGREHDLDIIRAGKLVEREIATGPEYGDRYYLEAKFPIYDDHGALYGTCGISTDITMLRRAEEERILLQEQVIAAQQAALRELSTPLIPLADGIVVMPLIGSMDSARAQQVIEGLLTGVAVHGASTAILDITGVPVVDTQVANALLQAAQATRLLGAEVLLTGIRPEVAQTLVGLGVELHGIITRSSLQSGIVYALARRRAGKSR